MPQQHVNFDVSLVSVTWRLAVERDPADPDLSRPDAAKVQCEGALVLGVPGDEVGGQPELELAADVAEPQ